MEKGKESQSRCPPAVSPIFETSRQPEVLGSRAVLGTSDMAPRVPLVNLLLHKEVKLSGVFEV